MFSIEDGKIVLIEDFTGKNANSDWWLDTKAVHIEGASGVIIYGEIEPLSELNVGDSVTVGQLLGTVKRVLRHDKGRPTSMLHVELYKYGSRQSGIWTPNKTKNDNMLNPTDLLVSVAKLRGIVDGK